MQERRELQPPIPARCLTYAFQARQMIADMRTGYDSRINGLQRHDTFTY
jgi:hypothetical protein